MSRFDRTRHPGVEVHESAYVDEPCEIGAGTQIWHFTHVMENARIGRRCRIGQNVLVASGVTLGDNVKVQNNVSLYTGVVLEDDVFCGPSMVFTNVVTPRSEIVRRGEYVTTLVRRGASLGANCTVVCGVQIGRYALVGAGAVVTKDVVDYGLVVGVPSRRVGWACRCGLTLAAAANGRPGRYECGGCGNVYAQAGERLDPVQENQS